MSEAKISIPGPILHDIYIALLESYERLPNATANIKRCLNYLEKEHRYEPPKDYITQEAKNRLDIRERELKLKQSNMGRLPFHSIIENER